MPKYVVIAERIIAETTIVEANDEAEAIQKAIELDNSKWVAGADIDWEIVRANPVT